jgi:hypothetical protein
LAQRALTELGTSVRLACQAFGISQTCYRYRAKLSAENDEIAAWLVRLTYNQRNRGFGLCYLYLHNVNPIKKYHHPSQRWREFGRVSKSRPSGSIWCRRQQSSFITPF